MPLTTPDTVTVRLDPNLSRADGRPRATLTLDQRGAALALANTRGAVVWSAPP
jgi:hypothetical protein